MTIEEHATSLETALRQLVRVDRRHWTTPEDKEALCKARHNILGLCPG